VAQHVLAAGRDTAVTVTWREGSKGTLTARFVFLRVRPAGHRITPDPDGTLPERWLIAEWPDDAAEPVTFWLSSQPAGIHPTDLIRNAKIRWRIEHDYRELKTGLGPDHSKAAPGPAGTATSPLSPPRTRSSPCCGSTQKRLRRPDPLQSPPRAATHARNLDRRMPHLPPNSQTVTPQQPPTEPTKHY
jgi:hypothetical protein